MTDDLVDTTVPATVTGKFFSDTRMGFKAVTSDRHQASLIREHFVFFQIDLELKVTQMKALSIGLHNQRSGLGLDYGFLSTGIRMTSEKHIDTVDDAGQIDIRVDIPFYFRMCLIIGLHGCRFTLVSQQHDEVHVRPQQFYIFGNDCLRSAHFQPGDIRWVESRRSILT